MVFFAVTAIQLQMELKLVLFFTSDHFKSDHLKSDPFKCMTRIKILL